MPVASTAGESLGEIRDVLGAVLAMVTSHKNGFILYRLSSLAVHEGEALLRVGTPVGQ
jgi:predicted deacylase